ncbi:ABC transporter permease [Mycoplasmopsis fermentans]|uniref:ABC transporter permease n=1 Tax=Mycoplasmopsis fermentans TaxID=2115 RepID=UPI0001E3303A|nr:ABC transporter permease [Mycoplasmopsis fermentans]ADN68843.1 oligopeptide ABC transporter [Mycoplasmopsis fermentans JER]RMX36003.1 binding--dependent transport system inner membrane component family protein [Mycoplasmopsis fermentans MF-I1]
MDSRTFNDKYNISDELIQKIKLAEKEKKSTNIVGKPKILFYEICKRFFKNPVVLISFTAFIALLLTGIIVTLTSPYSPTGSILKGGDELTQNLPPVFSPVITNASNYETFQRMKEWEGYHYIEPYLKDVIVNSKEKLLIYNAYDFWKAYYIWSRALKINPLRPEDIENIKASMPHLNTLFGTTVKEADIWTGAWFGAISSIKVALIVATIEVVIGVAVGAILGFHAGKWLDTVMMRVIEIFQAPPSVIWLLLFISAAGTSEWVLIAGLLFVGWTWPIGATRMFIITVKDEEYIIAAKSVGASTSRQIFFHALPAILGKIAMNYVRRIPSIILSIASLAFLGFYNKDTDINLGKFIYDNINDAKTNPWLMWLPTLILLTLSVSLQFIAIGLHDALDPRVIKVKG